jgi:hypothetical protein
LDWPLRPGDFIEFFADIGLLLALSAQQYKMDGPTKASQTDLTLPPLLSQGLG